MSSLLLGGRREPWDNRARPGHSRRRYRRALRPLGQPRTGKLGHEEPAVFGAGLPKPLAADAATTPAAQNVVRAATRQPSISTSFGLIT